MSLVVELRGAAPSSRTWLVFECPPVERRKFYDLFRADRVAQRERLLFELHRPRFDRDFPRTLPVFSSTSTVVVRPTVKRIPETRALSNPPLFSDECVLAGSEEHDSIRAGRVGLGFDTQLRTRVDGGDHRIRACACSVAVGYDTRDWPVRSARASPRLVENASRPEESR